jgi:hypothetical protein
MAVMRQGILGGLRNKIGSVVGTSWKGIAVLKSLPLSVANPRTTPQVNQRTKFAAVVAFASAINSGVIKPLWDRFAQRKSGNNAFVARNIDSFNNLGILSSPEDIVISEGKMSATPIATAVADVSSNTITITWSTTLTDSFQANTDLAYLLAYQIEGNKFGTNVGTVLRSAGTAVITAEVEDSEVWNCYLAFKRTDGTIVSDTAYEQASIVP